jgi:hypothetical protein
LLAIALIQAFLIYVDQQSILTRVLAFAFLPFAVMLAFALIRIGEELRIKEKHVLAFLMVLFVLSQAYIVLFQIGVNASWQRNGLFEEMSFIEKNVPNKSMLFFDSDTSTWKNQVYVMPLVTYRSDSFNYDYRSLNGDYYVYADSESVSEFLSTLGVEGSQVRLLKVNSKNGKRLVYIAPK